MEATAGPGNEREKWAFTVSATHFCKLKVHRFTGYVVIDQMVAVVDRCRIINPKAAENQIIGAHLVELGWPF
ncbi:molybdopterin cofactor-binding domain-containing protein [Faecalibacter sp. LW9]|uniref:molybdopterin cofactor-binding domain-containing protein n=1 Tax=Faecalibacter sp. LW9 TaxID=3103144 RepID=UPI002AFFDABA|nr:molybdopterin cofactor-binding domain-containing protein [Faecalibacter sp. LW9]